MRKFFTYVSHTRGRLRKMAGLFLVALICHAAAFAGNIYTVINTSDDINTSGSLRWCINQANGVATTTASPHLIKFNISASGVQTINVAGQMIITQPMRIDGFTQWSASNPSIDNRRITIQLKPSAPGVTGVGIFVVQASGTIICGINFITFPSGTAADAAIGHSLSTTDITTGVWIWGCNFGTDPGGTSTYPNQGGFAFAVYGNTSGINGALPGGNGNRSNLSGWIIGTNGDGNDDDKEGNIFSQPDPAANSASEAARFNNCDNFIIAGNYFGLNQNGTDPLQTFNPNAKFHWEGLSLVNCTGFRIGTNGDGTSDVQERNIFVGMRGAGVAIQGNNALGTTYWNNGDATSSCRPNGNNVVTGNYFGTDKTGMATGANLQNFNGVRIWTTSGNTVGGNTAVMRNVIVNSYYSGVIFRGDQYRGISTASQNNTLTGNYIGVLKDGTTPLSNAIGVALNTDDGPNTNNQGQNDVAAYKNTISNNIIANNRAGGIQVRPTSNGVLVYDNTITQNTIYNNTGLGINLGSSVSDISVTGNNGLLSSPSGSNANLLMNYGIIQTARLSQDNNTLNISGFIGKNPLGNPAFANAKVEFFIANNNPADQNGERFLGDGLSMPHGEGKTYLGSLTADNTGRFSGSLNVFGKGLTSGTLITNTATSTSGSTSEFGADIVLGLNTDPDFNETYVNVPVKGNVSTNDEVPPGTTYGTPTTIPGYINPNPSMPVVQSDGSYTFVSNTAGVYEFIVPVCNTALGICVNETLTITVLEKNKLNPPVANPDWGTTKVNTSITINTLANDKPGTPGSTLVPSTVVIIDKNGTSASTSVYGGTVTVDPLTGNTRYTPPFNFTGKDTIYYRVCDNQSPRMCATSIQIITVIPTDAPNSTVAVDDYNTTPMNTPAKGNVKDNDYDPEGDPQTVNPQNTTKPGQGTLVLNADGTYVFTPVNNYVGPVDFGYKTCDNKGACDSATLHILVTVPGLNTTPDFNETYVNVPVSGNVSTNDNVPPGTTYGTPTNVPGYTNPNSNKPVVQPDGSYTFVTDKPGVYEFIVPVCNADIGKCVNETLTITVLDKNNPNPPVANPDWTTTKMNVPVTINTLANDKPGTPGSQLVPSTVVVINKNGTAVSTSTNGGMVTVDPLTGNTRYTPPTGFLGNDTIYYKVCDNQSPSMCATSIQIITVIPPDAVNTTVAVDDYVTTPMNTVVKGNVKDNDYDPEGDIQTVTPQNITKPEGKLVLNSDGTYTFTPTNNYVGPVDFPYTTCDNGTPQACASATLHILVTQQQNLKTDPDFNETYVNVSVKGNVSTNDDVPPGTTYGTPTTVPGYTNPNTSMPVVQPDGNYTFISNTPGVYEFIVPVCFNSYCVNEMLTITVLDKNNPNPPVANPDWATTKVNVPVTINTLANDKPGTPGSQLVPATVVIINKNGTPASTSTKGGTVTVNTANGNTTYIPPAGFIGKDTIYYRVCDNQIPSMCATSIQIITVIPPDAPNSTVAVDDYNTTPMNTPVSGNVKDNDYDPEGDPQTVNPQNTTKPGQGTLVLNPDGTYTFTPVNNYVGPVDFGYKTCDNKGACDSATLHILVTIPQLKTNPDFNETWVNTLVIGNVSTNDNVPTGTTYGMPTYVPGYTNPNTSMPAVSPTGKYSFESDLPGVYEFIVPVCYNNACINELLTITVLDSTIGALNPPVANTDWATTKINVPVTINTLANDKPGTPGSALVPSTVTIIDGNGPLAGNTTKGGTVTVNPANGNTTYTPPVGFTGKDTVYYKVCDDQFPSMCATAIQVITVIAANSTNTTVAVDDYNTTKMNVPVSGNVKDNDYDPEGDIQTVTPQTTTMPGKGTLVLSSDGNYTFTPANDYTGPVDFPYTTCDNGTPQACASATLHILVAKGPDLTPSIDISGLNFVQGGAIQERDFIVDVFEVLGYNALSSVKPIQVKIMRISAFDISVPGITLKGTPTSGINGTSVGRNGIRTNENGNWLFSDDGSFITITAKPGININAGSKAVLGFHIKLKNNVPPQTSQNLTVTVVPGSGGEVNYKNNTATTTLTNN